MGKAEFQELEQVHVRGIFCRGLRLELVAGLGLALAIPAMAVAAESQGMATQISLAAATSVQDGHTQAALTIHVLGVDGFPATGAVSILDQGKPLAGVVLDEKGYAQTTLTLTGSAHALTAVYSGDSTHRLSSSSNTEVKALDSTSGTPDFTVSVAPATLTLTVGNSGAVIATVNPVNASALTSPMFVTLSCSSGLPDQASCTAFPATVEIQSNTTTAPTSTLTFVTQKASTVAMHQGPLARIHPIALALLFPGALGLAGMAWGARRRRWLSRVSMVALVGMITMLGTTGCNPRYSYLNHSPDPNPATPAGNYTVTISAQSSNGVTATTHTTTMALTVQ